MSTSSKQDKHKNSLEYGDIIEQTIAKDYVEYLRRRTFVPFVKQSDKTINSLPEMRKSDIKSINTIKVSDFYRNLVEQDQKKDVPLNISDSKSEIGILFEEYKITCPKVNFEITDSNRGYQMMKNSGWNETGLGPNENGRMFPIPTTIKNDRRGVGTTKNESKITHVEFPKKEHPKRQRNWVAMEERKSKHWKRKVRDEIYGPIVPLEQIQEDSENDEQLY